MPRNFMAPLKRVRWGKISDQAGAFLLRHRSKALGAMYAAGGILVVLLVHREVYSFIASCRQFRAPQVEARVAPKWAGRDGVEVVQVGKDRMSLCEPGLVERVGRAFEDCPWVRRVTAVERAFPDHLRVTVEYRTPHVAVRRSNGYVLVDREGVRLPGVYADPPRSLARKIEIGGVASLPPEPGRPWTDPALRTGMALVEFVQENPLLARLKVREVEVSNYGGRVDPRKSEIGFTTAGGATIAWGRAPGQGKFGEPSVEEKLENLRETLMAYPNLQGVRTVKVYFRGSRAVELGDLVKKPK